MQEKGFVADRLSVWLCLVIPVLLPVKRRHYKIFNKHSACYRFRKMHGLHGLRLPVPGLAIFAITLRKTGFSADRYEVTEKAACFLVDNNGKNLEKALSKKF